MSKEAFDWVRARNDCSLLAVFRSLQSAAEKDVETRNALRGKADEYRFIYKSNPKTEGFFVIREGNFVGLTISFQVVGSAILVTEMPSNHELLTAVPTLTNERACMLKVNSQELEEWQVLKLALEALFFEITETR